MKFMEEIIKKDLIWVDPNIICCFMFEPILDSAISEDIFGHTSDLRGKGLRSGFLWAYFCQEAHIFTRYRGVYIYEYGVKKGMWESGSRGAGSKGVWEARRAFHAPGFSTS
jgi:hypothetical protein